MSTRFTPGATWGVFSVFFFALNLLTTSYWWFLFPTLSWGLAVALHALKVYMPGDSEEQRVDPEVAKGVEVLMNESQRRVRVGGVERVRVGAADSAEVSGDPAPEEAPEMSTQDRKTLKRAQRTARREKRRR